MMPWIVIGVLLTTGIWVGWKLAEKTEAFLEGLKQHCTPEQIASAFREAVDEALR